MRDIVTKTIEISKKILIFLFLDSKEENRTIEKTIKSFLWALLIAVFIRSFFYEPFYIPSGSMKPGLLEGDFIIVSKYDFGYTKYSFPFAMLPFNGRIGFNKSNVKRGDVLVFRTPKDPSVAYIKRLIGLPGDKIQVIDSILYINDSKIEKEYVGDFIENENEPLVKGNQEIIDGNKFITLDKMDNPIADNTPIFNVPEGYYFFMGDNRDNSLDSRFLDTGFIPEENLIGKARVIFFSKWGTIFKFWNNIRWTRIFKVIR
ncbi:MAG: signal peptidase I [Rickettsiales bacterium]|jgi:signal peptidase I|nr:signal peptidase I [Rickettsiales bacterium]